MCYDNIIKGNVMIESKIETHKTVYTMLFYIRVPHPITYEGPLLPFLVPVLLVPLELSLVTSPEIVFFHDHLFTNGGMCERSFGAGVASSGM